MVERRPYSTMDGSGSSRLFEEPPSFVLSSGMTITLDADLLTRCSLTRCFATWFYYLDSAADGQFLLQGIANGFSIVSDLSCITPADCPNYSSALAPEVKPLLDKLFREELDLGRLSRQADKPLRIQAIGAVPKTGSNVPRPITDCSRPCYDPLNSYITAERFSFESIEDVVSISHPYCFYAIADIKSAYRHVPIFPPHRQLQGLRWSFDGVSSEYLIDNFLCFGLKHAPSIFNKLSSAVTTIIRSFGHKIVSYLDDFLVVSTTREQCLKAQQDLISLLHRLGFDLKWDKVVSPSQRVQFLGLIIDSAQQRIELPKDKLQRLANLAEGLSQRRTVQRRELEVLVGHMTFASKPIYGARTFTRLFIDALNSVSSQSHYVTLNKVLKRELQWWHRFATDLNGLCPCRLGYSWSEKVTIYTDACFIGFGAVMDDTFLLGTWNGNSSLSNDCETFSRNLVPQPLVDSDLLSNINYLELIAACLPLLIWAPQFSGKQVTIASDNKSTVSFVNRGTTKNHTALLWLKLVLYCSLKHDFRFNAIYHPGVQNVAADALSRLAISSSFGSKFLETFSHPFPGPTLPNDFYLRYPNVVTGVSLVSFEAKCYGELFSCNEELAMEDLPVILQ